MATYYVRKSGSDSNNGTTPALAWATISKALGASGISSGDTVYIGAGTYRETVQVLMTAPAATTSVIADWDGSQTGDSGEIILTAYTTNDTTAPSATRLFDFNNRGNLTVKGFTMIGGSAPIFSTSSGSWGTNITISNCTLIQAFANQHFYIQWATPNAALNTLVDSCTFIGPAGSDSLDIYAPKSGTADYSVGIKIQNCRWVGGCTNAIYLNSTGSGTNFGGGVTVANCSSFGCGTFIYVAAGSTSQPVTVKACTGITSGAPLNSAAGTGCITEDYNVLRGGVANNLVSAGANSHNDGSYAMMCSFGQEWQIGSQPRPEATPLYGSPLLGIAPTIAPSPNYDWINRTRPEGCYPIGSTGYAIGYVERHNTAIKETSVTKASSTSIRIIGPGSQDFQLAVDPGARSVSVWVQYDATYGTTNPAQLKLTGGGECGVADQIVSTPFGGAVNTWYQITINFNPTSKGVVTLRCISQSGFYNGNCYFDEFVVS